MFRAFLEEGRARPRRLRAHIGSGALHALLLLALGLLAQDQLRPEPLLTAPTIAVSLMRPALRVAAATDVAPAAASSVHAEAAPRARRAAPRPRPAPVLAALVQPVQPLDDLPVDDGLLPYSEPAAGGSGAGDVLTVADPGNGSGPGRRRRPELFARIVGSGIRAGTALPADRTFISLKEATALRTHDFFPRLPAMYWTDRGPYLVAVEVCVSEEGQVTEAALRSSASARLDPLVLAAVRSWRYRPRLEAGKPAPFCHGVLIRYDLSY